MKKKYIRIAAGIAVAAILATSFPTTEVYAASDSVFPSAGAARAAGIGTSIYDIRAMAARNAARKDAALAQAANNGVTLVASKASVVSTTDEETGDTSGKDKKKKKSDKDKTEQEAMMLPIPQPVGNVSKVETPSSKAYTEGTTVDGVSIVGSASTAAQIEVTESDPSVQIASEEEQLTTTPSIEVAPEEVEVGEGEEDFTRTVIAQCDSYVHVRDIPDESGEIVGKLYNNSAGTWLGKEGDWYKIESGSVTGYVKGQYVITGQEAVKRAEEVGIRTAVVTTTTLKVREEASIESKVLGMVGMEDSMTVVEETDEWVKVQIEEGDGWINKEYVSVTTDFPKAESKAEEEARLKKEEEERRKANAAAQKATKKNKNNASYAPVSVAGSGMGAQVANYACQFIGNPYVYGGTSLTNGTDCSGFTMSVYRNFGVSLPHSSGAQRACGYAVGSIAEAQPGDIICYSGHVALYIGNGQIVHASTAATGIKISNVSYRSILAIRRIF